MTSPKIVALLDMTDRIRKKLGERDGISRGHCDQRVMRYWLRNFVRTHMRSVRIPWVLIEALLVGLTEAVLRTIRICSYGAFMRIHVDLSRIFMRWEAHLE